MKTKAMSIKTITDVETLPDGKHSATWGGYEVNLEINAVKYFMVVDNGIRTPSAPCFVVVKDGKVVEIELA